MKATNELKDLAYFQQQVAKKYNFNSFYELIDQGSGQLSITAGIESIEAYAQHRYEQGKQEGEEGLRSYIDELEKALSILNGLKQEEG